MAESAHELAIRTRVRDLGARRDLGLLGTAGMRAGQSIAGGFLRAQIALGALRMGIRAIIGAIRSVTTEAIADMDRLDDAAQQVGVSTEWLSEMEHAAQLSGASLETLVVSLRNVARTTTGPGSVEAAFDAAADAIGRAASETERVAMAQQLFGRSGTDLLPLLRAGAAGIREMREEAQRMGLSLLKTDAILGSAADDAIRRLSESFRGLKRAIAVEFLPSLTKAFNALSEWMAENRGEIVEQISSVVRWLGNALLDAIEVVGRTFAKLLDAITTFDRFSKSAGGVVMSLAEWIQDLNVNLGGQSWGISRQDYEEFYREAGRASASYEKTFAQTMARVRAEIQKTTAAIESLPPPTRDMGEIEIAARRPSWLERFRGHAAEAGIAATGMRGGIEKLRAATDPEALGLSAIKSISDAWGQFFDALIDGTKSAADAFRSFATSILRDLARMAQQRFLAQLLGAVLGSSGGGAAVPATAAGGIVTRPQIRLVGEAGPEAIIPLHRLRDSPGGGISVQIGDIVVAGGGGRPDDTRRSVAAGVADALRNSAALRAIVRKTAREGF